MKILLLLPFVLVFQFFFKTANAQQKVDFYGNPISAALCDQLAFTDDEQAQTCLNNICGAAGVKNVYIMIPCSNINNCVARFRNHKAYILYDNSYLNKIRTFGFTEKNLPLQDINWSEITIMAHEIGHHVLGHLSDPSVQDRYTIPELELQADEFAGGVLYKLKASLAQAQLVMYDDLVEVNGSNSHPARSLRLNAIRTGYLKARNSDPAVTGGYSAETVLQNLKLHVYIDRSDLRKFDDTDHGTQKAFKYYLEGEDRYLNQIKEVRYVRDHDSFYEFVNNTYQSSGDRDSKFTFKGYQWGYINYVDVTVILKNGGIAKQAEVQIIYDNN